MTGSARLIDLTGRRYGRLVVIAREPSVNNRTRWRARCDCGNETIAVSHDMRTGKTSSCGCLHRECASRLSAARIEHGQAAGVRTRTYVSWCQMHQRCRAKTGRLFRWYAAKGVAVCERWATFTAFLADMGERPPGTSLDRIDGTRGYEPGNCRWADAVTQGGNTSTTVVLAAFGEKKSAAQWALDPRCSVKATSLLRRIHKGMSPEAAITTPRTDPAGLALGRA